MYTLETQGPVTIEHLAKEYPTVFWPGVGRLKGKYRIVVDESVPSVQHPPCCVPVPIQQVLKDTLDDLVQQAILAPV